MPDPVSGNFHIIDINTGDALRSGDFVSARIRAVLPNGRFILYCKGRQFTASSPLSFSPGEVIRARVEQSGKGIILHLIHSGSAGKRGIPSLNPPETLLTASLIRAGLSLTGEAETLRRTSLLERTRGSRLRMARLYAELLSKGADPSAGFLESIERIFSGDAGGRGAGKWPTPPEPDKLKAELTEEKPENTGDKDLLINLLNSVQGKKDKWMFRKIAGKLGDGEVSLMWKIRSGLNPALALTVHDGSRIFEFLMEGLENTRMAVYTGNKAEVSEKEWDSFRRRLALLKIDVDDTILPLDRSDGFSPGSEEVLQDLEGWV